MSITSHHSVAMVDIYHIAISARIPTSNADNAINEDGSANTAHSLNPVPFIYVTENKQAKVQNGVLADVAPSILHIMGLEQPADMTGKNLIED